MDALHNTIHEAQNALQDILDKTACSCRSCETNLVDSFANYTYFPCGEYDEENKHFTAEMFSTSEIKLFDMGKTKFASYSRVSNPRVEMVEDLRRFYIASDRKQNIQSASGLFGVDFLYRNCPISWGEFTYLNPPNPCKAGDLSVLFIEHPDPQRRTEDELVENDRYTRIMKQNFKFSFFYRHAEICESITGFYRGPAQYGNRRSWDQVWRLFRSDPSRIKDFVRRLCFQSNSDHVDFMRFIKSEISAYYQNLRLDQPEIWEREESLRIEVSIFLN